MCTAAAEGVRLPLPFARTAYHQPHAAPTQLSPRATTGRCHETVSHRIGEYSCEGISVNGWENFFSRFKRSISGVHHKVSREHLHRYATHMEWLHNIRHLTDGERVAECIRMIDGKRLTHTAAVLPRLSQFV